MKKNNLKVVKIDQNKSLFNYEKKILIKDLILDLKLGYYDFEKEKTQKVKFSLEIDYEDKKPTSDKDIKSIVNYGQVVKIIKKHKPKFNILLKDDKSFPFVFISNKDQWAQVTKHRGKKDKEGFYLSLIHI